MTFICKKLNQSAAAWWEQQGGWLGRLVPTAAGLQ
jgi:hypothetical protein